MSVAYCDRDGFGPIDTDDEPEAVQPPGSTYPILCESCRERVAIQLESGVMP